MKLFWLTFFLAASPACSFDGSTEANFLDDGAPVISTDGAANDSLIAADGSEGPAPDAAQPTCQTYSAFTSPTLISEVSSSSLDNAPTLSGDELTMVFHSLRAGGQGNRDLWISQRASIAQPFASPSNMNVVNGGSDEYGPSLSADGLELYFGSNRSGGLGDFDIWRATRATSGDPFSAPVALPSVNSSTTDYFPFVTADGLSLYLASSRSGGQGNFDVWVSTRVSTASAFAAPTNVAEVNSTASDEATALSSDGLSIFVQSGRTGTLGGPDVWLATRQSLAQPFSGLSNLTEVNTSAQDQATWLSPDGLRLYQSSDRGGSWSIYSSSRVCTD